MITATNIHREGRRLSTLDRGSRPRLGSEKGLVHSTTEFRKSPDAGLAT